MRPLNKKGFTLPEILVTAFILAYSLSVILATFVNCTRLSEASRNITIANSHASYILEDIRNTLFSTVATKIASGTWTLDSAGVNATGMSALKSETITTVDMGGTNPIDIQVTVAWNDEGRRARTLVLRTLVGG